MFQRDDGFLLGIWRKSFLFMVKLLKSITDRLGMEPICEDGLEDDRMFDSGVWASESNESLPTPSIGLLVFNLGWQLLIVEGSISKINRLALICPTKSPCSPVEPVLSFLDSCGCSERVTV